MKSYYRLWALLTALLSFEYWALNYHTQLSVIHFLQAHFRSMSSTNLSTAAGRPISYLLGWAGFGLILLTNLYILRRKWAPLKKIGTLPGWLNFHIFCGLLGPTLIVFHSALKVRGVVGISFWSMMIVALSGIIGRYIYVQLLREEKLTSNEAKNWSEKLERLRISSGAAQVTTQDVDLAKELALNFVGFPEGGVAAQISLPRILFESLWGDLRLAFSAPPPVPGLPEVSRHILAAFAVSRRRAVLLEPFRKMLGYWHSFHLPFALFMYIAAIIHIISALTFGI